MDFEWDEAKAISNERKHGISFPIATIIFGNNPLIESSPRDHTHEERFIAIGEVAPGQTIVLTVTYTPRNAVTRIISARPASTQERKRYQAHR